LRNTAQRKRHGRPGTPAHKVRRRGSEPGECHRAASLLLASRCSPLAATCTGEVCAVNPSRRPTDLRKRLCDDPADPRSDPPRCRRPGSRGPTRHGQGHRRLPPRPRGGDQGAPARPPRPRRRAERPCRGLRPLRDAIRKSRQKSSGGARSMVADSRVRSRQRPSASGFTRPRPWPGPSRSIVPPPATGETAPRPPEVDAIEKRRKARDCQHAPVAESRLPARRGGRLLFQQAPGQSLWATRRPGAQGAPGRGRASTAPPDGTGRSWRQESASGGRRFRAAKAHRCSPIMRGRRRRGARRIGQRRLLAGTRSIRVGKSRRVQPVFPLAIHL
jgi:hypothetical protein